MPYLIATDPGFEGTLQKIFDRELSHRPVLLIEFPLESQARLVLGAIGAGERTYSLIAPHDVIC